MQYWGIFASVDEDGQLVWGLTKFAQTLSELGSINSITKSHHVYNSLPLCVREILSFADHSSIVSFEDLLSALYNLDYQGLAMRVEQDHSIPAMRAVLETFVNK